MKSVSKSKYGFQFQRILDNESYLQAANDLAIDSFIN